MRIKPGVRIAGLRPEMILCLHICDEVYKTYGYLMTITSAVDSKHGSGSLHFVGAAVDLRTRDLSANHTSVIKTEMDEALGDDFDVVLEHNHFHIEFQPKTPINL